MKPLRTYRRGAAVPAIERLGLALAALLALAAPSRAEFKETPYFRAAVAQGRLPPVADRLPQQPAVAKAETIGRPGGTLHMLMASPKDTKMMVVYGYARLVAYTPSLDLVPDILQSLDVKDGRIFTLHLRAGQKWSDGRPFTAKDFEFWFKAVAENRKLSPGGLPTALLADGEAPQFEVLNDTTVRYSWSRPNPLFLPALAGPDPLFIYCPAHYMKQYHMDFADKAKLRALVKKSKKRNWTTLFDKYLVMYRNNNPKLPTLEPWILKTKPPSDRYIFVRNPYYYRVDKAGQQLPYMDRVVLSMADAKIIPAMTGAGESDLQARYLDFDNYTFLKSAEARNRYKVRLWRTGPGSQLALYPNLNVNDPVWRALVRKPAFRRALSLAVNRHEINQVIYFGLAIEGQNTLLPQSPLYNAPDRAAWAQFDLAEANRLLDGLGLAKRDSDGTRLLPDGRPMRIIVESSGESVDRTDVLELIRDSWRHIGISLFTRPMQLTLFRRRVFSGDTLMAIDKGIENGLATADMPPSEFAPTTQEQLQWPKWGQYAETGGKAGKKPDVASAVRLLRLYRDWLAAAGPDERRAIWQKMLAIWADKVYTIGLVGGVLQPVVVGDGLRNVPPRGMYNWDPGAGFGMYKPDAFWLAKKAKATALAAPPPLTR
ncbi:MAG TPA: ABC transporter substrate-binding protein [Stellaceae bacterium]|nr:ABC transporter substrate-binding protein [Stellaceae bacterium]